MNDRTEMDGSNDADKNWMLDDYADELRDELSAEDLSEVSAAGDLLDAGRPRESSEEALRNRLESILQAGVTAISADAATLWVLDDATTEVSACASYGDWQRDQPPEVRPLAGAVGDLEAMCGHAIVLEDEILHDTWCVPRACGAAVCLPVATHLSILGTLWVYSDSPRGFSDEETNLLEIIAGRLATELELDKVTRRRSSSDGAGPAVGRAAEIIRGQLPSWIPELDGLDLAGWTNNPSGYVTCLHDWLVRSDGQLVVLVAGAVWTGRQRTWAEILTAQSTRAALRAHAEHAIDAASLLRMSNATLYSGSAGDQPAAAAAAIIDPRSGTGTAAVAGSVAVHLLGQDCGVVPVPEGPVLGLEPEASYLAWPFSLENGCSLISCLSVDRPGDPNGWQVAAAEMVGLDGLRSGDLAGAVRGSLQNQGYEAAGVVVRAGALTP